jgi:crotonobetainyl-CoA:carnitine CoA-transferase CaiB-like acyl-CoA transferase
MADNLAPFLYWAHASGSTTGSWPGRGAALLTGGSPRYALYRTADGRHLAAAPLEERFWQTFCDVIDLPAALRDDSADPRASKAAVAERIITRTAAEWERRFTGVDACCNVVRTLEEAAERAGGQPLARAPDGSAAIPALSLPLAPPVRCALAGSDHSYPTIGEATELLPEPTSAGG